MFRQIKKLIPAGCILAGCLLCLYPWISNYCYQKSAGSEIKSYQKKSKNIKKKRYQTLYQEARKYNEKLTESNVALTDPFEQQNKNTEALAYKKQLCVDESGIMGYVEIPCISVELPIFHGTSSSVLEKGAGHLVGSSLPIGGKGTHSVITGHTGLSHAKMFTDLTEMKKGDLFYIHVLDRTLAYKADNISVVLPEETAQLAIDNGQDYVTLVTCTPYGVNDHRLFVRGKRTKYVKQEYNKIEKSKKSQWMKTYRKALLIGVCAGFLLFLMFHVRRKIEERRRKI